jgi:hypothetical protein
MEEIYKPINEFEEYFQISNLCNIKSIKTGNILKCRLSANGYKTIYLRTKDKSKNYTLHSLLANHFIDKPISDEKLIVDHIDGNKLNNNISNLRWISYSDNVKNAHINNINYKNVKKRIYKLNLNNEIIEEYSSINDAVIKNGFKYNTDLIRCCKR